MYYSKIDIEAAKPLTAEPVVRRTDYVIGMVMLLGLPLVALGLIAQHLARDVTTGVRAAGTWIALYAAELARR